MVAAAVWDAGGKIIVSVLGNPNILNVALPSMGNTAYLIGSQTKVWAATAGNISWTLFIGIICGMAGGPC